MQRLRELNPPHQLIQFSLPNPPMVISRINSSGSCGSTNGGFSLVWLEVGGWVGGWRLFPLGWRLLILKGWCANCRRTHLAIFEKGTHGFSCRGIPSHTYARLESFMSTRIRSVSNSFGPYPYWKSGPKIVKPPLFNSNITLPCVIIPRNHHSWRGRDV